MARRYHIVSFAVGLLFALSCTSSIGTTPSRIGIDELKGVLLRADDLPEYVTTTDEGVMRPERLQNPGREGVDTGYGILYEVRSGGDIPGTPLKIILSEVELYKDSQAASDAISVRPGLIVQDSQKSGPQVLADEVEVGSIAEEARAVRLDIVDLNDVQYTILFRHGRMLGSIVVVAAKDYGEIQLLQSGEQLAQLVADRMAQILENQSD